MIKTFFNLKRICLASVLFIFLFNSATAQNFENDWKVGEPVFYENNWVEVIPGDIPLVLSVPHGGEIRPQTIPDRTCPTSANGTTVTVTDLHTIDLALAIQNAFLEKFKRRPFIIISNIARIKVDQNRALDEAVCDKNDFSEKAWYEFHNAIDTALAKAVSKFGYSLYIDLHGHGHKNQRLELGYLLNGTQVEEAYKKEKGPDDWNMTSSLQNLLSSGNNESFWDLVWGENSFGTLIYKEGAPATPSRQDPYPLPGEKFFSGGYNTKRYTSKNYPGVFGWQIESNFRGVRDNENSRKNFGEEFVKAYTEFIEKNKSLLPVNRKNEILENAAGF